MFYPHTFIVLRDLGDILKKEGKKIQYAFIYGSFEWKGFSPTLRYIIIAYGDKSKCRFLKILVHLFSVSLSGIQLSGWGFRY